MGYSISKQEYYKFKDVDKTLKTGKKKFNISSKKSKKNKKTKKLK